jgi:hypothetical protein
MEEKTVFMVIGTLFTGNVPPLLPQFLIFKKAFDGEGGK